MSCAGERRMQDYTGTLRGFAALVSIYCDGSSTDVLLTRDNNYFNNVYITVALSPGGIISGWYSVVLTALYH